MGPERGARRAAAGRVLAPWEWLFALGFVIILCGLAVWLLLPSPSKERGTCGCTTGEALAKVVASESSSTTGNRGYMIQVEIFPLTKLAREFPGTSVIDHWAPLPKGMIVPVYLERGGDFESVTLGSWNGLLGPLPIVSLGLLLLLISLLLKKATSTAQVPSETPLPSGTSDGQA